MWSRAPDKWSDRLNSSLEREKEWVRDKRMGEFFVFRESGYYIYVYKLLRAHTFHVNHISIIDSVVMGMVDSDVELLTLSDVPVSLAALDVDMFAVLFASLPPMLS